MRMIVYNDIMGKLSSKGYNSYRIRKENILPQSVITRIRNGESITIATIDKLCELLECQPGDLISYIPNDRGD